MQMMHLMVQVWRDYLTLCDWPVLTQKLNLGFNHCLVSPFTLSVNNFILPGLDFLKNDLMSRFWVDWRFIVAADNDLVYIVHIACTL